MKPLQIISFWERTKTAIIIILIALLAPLLSPAFLAAQAPDTVWTKTFGGSDDDRGSEVRQTSDGGYIITGSTSSFGNGSYDVWLIRTDANGDTMWTKTFGGGGNDRGTSVEQTLDGGYIVTGFTSSFGAGSYDIWLIKTDVVGDTIWARTFGGSGRDEGYSVQQTSDGGFIVCGNTSSFGAGSYDAWLIKTDINGDTLWTKTIGGNYWDEALSVQQTTDGGYIITGFTGLFGPNGDEVWLIKTDNDGDTQWTKNYGRGWGLSVQQTSDEGYIVTGYTYFAVGIGLYLIKTDRNGDTLWTKDFEGIGYSVQQALDGGYIIAGSITPLGHVESDLLLIKTDSAGTTQWTKMLGGTGFDYGLSVQQNADGEYITCGWTESFGAGGLDMWLIKLGADIMALDKPQQAIIKGYKLRQNHPNPFNPTTMIRFRISNRALVDLAIYDLSGKQIATLIKEERPAGEYEVEFDGSNLASGIYFYRLQAGQFAQVKKMILMK